MSLVMWSCLFSNLFAISRLPIKIIYHLYRLFFKNLYPINITFLIPFLSADTIQGLFLATALYPLCPYHLFCPHCHNNISSCHNHTSSYICNYYSLVFCSYFVILHFHYIISISAICLLPLPYLPESLRLHYQ